MSTKRSATGLSDILSKKQKTDADTAAANKKLQESSSIQSRQKNPYLSNPIKQPEQALAIFLRQARSSARKQLPAGAKLPITKPFVEVEARIGILKAPFGLSDSRVVSSGARTHARAFECTSQQPRALFESGVTRSHYVHWTQSGLSEVGPISQALGVSKEALLKRDLVQVETVETVYGGYKDDVRVCFPGTHPLNKSSKSVVGKVEHKKRLDVMDVTLPAAPYDLRMTLATEKLIDNSVQDAPPAGWTTRRIKRRRSYTRRDKSIAWQLDVTEVTTFFANRDGMQNNRAGEVTFEIEMELNAPTTLQLVNETNEGTVQKMVNQLAQQLWWMLYQINPLSDVLDVENYLVDHPDREAVKLALAQCGALKKFMDSHQRSYESPIANPELANSKSKANLKFMGCMPVNFSRHNIEEVQQSPENGYFLSEKTDGVRHLMVFTGKTAVLVDRAMAGKQVVLGNTASNRAADPMASVLPLIQAGTVLDGEVVMHRKLRRPIFIVFDVLAISPTEPVLHLPFEQRLRHLRQATFRTKTADRDMFANVAVMDPKVALPLVRKNFVKRMDLDDLISHVVEERGTRSYRNGDIHYHLTDGIIFQPNTPYVCGTDHRLLKWKYLDTVTIDVEILPSSKYVNGDDEDRLCVGVLGEEGTSVDMTRYVHLPSSERQRLEADRLETGSKIAEVGFDAATGEWYYLTMRPDKIAPNHISTVLGTLLELAESLTTEELRYRMSVPAGGRDTYRKDVRGMQKQLLEHQRKKNNAAAAAKPPAR